MGRHDPPERREDLLGATPSPRPAASAPDVSALTSIYETDHGTLRELPWFARTPAARTTRRLPALRRPRRFRHLTGWSRLRSGAVLLAACMVVALALLLALTLGRELAPLLPPFPTGLPPR